MMNETVTEDSVREDIKHLIAELTERGQDEITDTALLVEDLGIDSLMAIEILVLLDKRYKINIPGEEFHKIKNVNEVVSAVLRRRTRT
jgi:acyl carrier protein